MLIRLLQTFDAVELDLDAQPAENRPPADWRTAPGRQAMERIFPKSHLTMYSQGGLWMKLHEASN